MVTYKHVSLMYQKGAAVVPYKNLTLKKMMKVPFYFVANNLLTHGNDVEFQHAQLGSYTYELLDVVQGHDGNPLLDDSGNMSVRVLCIETQEAFDTTYDPQTYVLLNPFN